MTELLFSNVNMYTCIMLLFFVQSALEMVQKSLLCRNGLLAGVDAEPLEFPEQGVSMQPEDSSRLGLVPPDSLQDVQNILFFKLTAGLPEAPSMLLEVFDHVVV